MKDNQFDKMHPFDTHSFLKTYVEMNPKSLTELYWAYFTHLMDEKRWEKERKEKGLVLIWKTYFSL